MTDIEAISVPMEEERTVFCNVLLDNDEIVAISSEEEINKIGIIRNYLHCQKSDNISTIPITRFSADLVKFVLEHVSTFTSPENVQELTTDQANELEYYDFDTLIKIAETANYMDAADVLQVISIAAAQRLANLPGGAAAGLAEIGFEVDLSEDEAAQIRKESTWMSSNFERIEDPVTPEAPVFDAPVVIDEEEEEEPEAEVEAEEEEYEEEERAAEQGVEDDVVEDDEEYEEEL